MVVEAWLQRAAATAPAETALRTPEGTCSYAELHARACAGAQQLAEAGVAPGARVALALPAGLDFACALHACLLRGAVAVPVDLRLGAAERRAIQDGAALVLDEPLAGSLAPHSGSASVARPQTAARRASLPTIHLHDLNAVAVIIHTSGTTSAPKPVELTYGNFLWSALGSAVALGLDRRERWLCALPLAHVGGLSILLRSAIYATTAVVHPRFQTDAVLAELQGGAVTLVSLVATTLARLLDAGLQAPPALRCALLGGGPVAPTLLGRARAAGVPIALTYGLTEACSQATTTPLAALAREDDGQRQLAPNAGPPLFCTRLRLAPDGEIELAGPTLAPRAAAADGWLRTGDLGRLNELGGLQVTGRKADTIVSGGENVAPAEVEAVLEAHPAVLEAAALARPDAQWGEAVAALVVPRPDAALDAAELRAHCAAHLAPYKVPKHLALVAGPLPRTPSGKLLRRELR